MKRAILLTSVLILFLAACHPVNLNAPLPRYETGVDPFDWARIPAGEFLYGQYNEETVIPYDYEIMITDVTVSQYAEFLNEALMTGDIKKNNEAVVGYYPGDEFHGARHEEPVEAGEYVFIPLTDPSLRLIQDNGQFQALPGYENHPMTVVSWFGAWGYCLYYGWRLPTEVEWEKAARGTDGRPFPWGEEISRNHANFYASRDPFEEMNTVGSRTTPVGFYNGQIYEGYQTLNAVSPYGLYDMAGNVWQWMGDVHIGQHYRTLRGGSKDTYEYNLRVWSHNNATPTYVSPGVGFRCARDVQN